MGFATCIYVTITSILDPGIGHKQTNKQTIITVNLKKPKKWKFMVNVQNKIQNWEEKVANKYCPEKIRNSLQVVNILKDVRCHVLQSSCTIV